MQQPNTLHAGGAHRQWWETPLEEEVLVPLQTKIIAPGFAALFDAMMRKTPEQLIELASTSSSTMTMQLQPFDEIEEAPGK